MKTAPPPKSSPTTAVEARWSEIPSRAAAPGGPRLVQAADLFGPRSEVLIVHQGQQYRLRKTSLGKLILTK
ncbi:MAG TPA: hemin uptake protein HemP [Rubrivivax sp.]|jgi:hemin uptake protein HemP|nr:hemin uptake protein HemP [Rubrivivax sp.]